MELAFTRRFGIGVEFVPARGGSIIRRMADEARAGVQYFDIHIGGTESIITGLLPENVLEPVEPFFILPEVKDPKQWWGGHIWVDNAKRFVYAFVGYQTVSLWSNPNEYKPAEFRTFDDLLNPKLHGKIGISDPRTPGSGSSMWSYMLYAKGEEYLKRLVAQKLFVTRDLRAPAGGEPGKREDRCHLRDRLFGVPSFHQGQSSRDPSARSQGRSLRHRRLWSPDHRKESTSS
jgi:ABC-type Fe3+ transport system substrate-binding protein